jgi:hypothetical protein
MGGCTLLILVGGFNGIVGIISDADFLKKMRDK